jgi:hypothetical protein
LATWTIDNSTHATTAVLPNGELALRGTNACSHSVGFIVRDKTSSAFFLLTYAA